MDILTSKSKNIVFTIICILAAMLFFFWVYQPYETINDLTKSTTISSEMTVEQQIDFLSTYSHIRQNYIVTSFSLFFVFIFLLIGIILFFNGRDSLKKETILTGMISLLSAFFLLIVLIIANNTQEEKKEEKKVEKSENNTKEYIVQCKNELNEINNLPEVKKTTQVKPGSIKTNTEKKDCLEKH